MPIYLVSQRGVPGERMIEADKPASAISHVVDDSFTCERVDGRALVDAARKYELETAGGPKPTPEPVADKTSGDNEPNGGDDEPIIQRVDNPVDPEDQRPLTETDPDRLRDDQQDRQMNGE